jgi:hypothetical protein
MKAQPIMILDNRTTLPLPPIVLSLIILALAGCGGTSIITPPPPPGTKLSVSPASITVDAGSATAFTAIFTPAAPTGGSLTWSIVAVDGGTITGDGVYTASSNAGKYSILATWTPSLTSKAAILKGASTVTLLAVPQLDSAISPSQVQATGANQSAGADQNGAVVGQGIPSVASTDSGGNTQVLSGFTLPVSTCGPGSVCK